MNIKPFLAAFPLVVALGGVQVQAGDATQFEDTPSTRSREEVKAELEQARKDGTLMSGGEATVFVDRPVAAGRRSSDEARAENRLSSRTRSLDDRYVGG